MHICMEVKVNTDKLPGTTIDNGTTVYMCTDPPNLKEHGTNFKRKRNDDVCDVQNTRRIKKKLLQVPAILHTNCLIHCTGILDKNVTLQGGTLSLVCEEHIKDKNSLRIYETCKNSTRTPVGYISRMYNHNVMIKEEMDKLGSTLQVQLVGYRDSCRVVTLAVSGTCE